MDDVAENPRLYFFLKEIKRIAGDKNRISVTSTQIAENLHVSQQTASRAILDLIEEGYLARSMEKRKQNLKITEKGLSLLYAELSSLLRILGMNSTIQVRGIVSSGLGEGRYYISRKNYIIQFQERLEMIPYLGTLNLKVEQADWDKLRRLRTSDGILIDGFRTEDRTFGAVKAFRARIKGTEAAVIMPVRTVYTDVIEIISEVYLRDAFSLKDGDTIDVEVDL